MANKNRSPNDAFKEEHEMYPDITNFSHSLSLEIPINDKVDGYTTNVPKQLSLAFTTILSTDNNTTIETCNKQMIGSANDIFVDKAQFDEQFK